MGAGGGDKGPVPPSLSQEIFIRGCYIIPRWELYHTIITKKHHMVANFDFLLGFYHIKENYYVCRMLVLYFKNNKASFRGWRFS